LRPFAFEKQEWLESRKDNQRNESDADRFQPLLREIQRTLFLLIASAAAAGRCSANATLSQAQKANAPLSQARPKVTPRVTK
jgi:hypothetical protein